MTRRRVLGLVVALSAVVAIVLILEGMPGRSSAPAGMSTSPPGHRDAGAGRRGGPEPAAPSPTTRDSREIPRRTWDAGALDERRTRLSGERTDREQQRRLQLERELLRASTRRLGTDVADLEDAPRGHLDPEYIRSQIREISPLIRECYELTLNEAPELEGRLVAEFTISGEESVGGIVEESRIDESSELQHPLLSECVRETLYTVEFEAPTGGGQVVVRYPFVFSQAEPEEP